ncbi:MAG: phosphotransferase [Nocardioidaceae bacterium]
MTQDVTDWASASTFRTKCSFLAGRAAGRRHGPRSSQVAYRCGCASTWRTTVAAVPLTRGDDVASHFTAASTRAILAAACADLRIESADAVLLRHGENAVYRLAHDPLVARIARHPDVPRREVEVARWLTGAALPAVRLAEEAVQLRVIDGRVVTWWALVVESRQKPTFTDLAVMLRRLHDLPEPTTFALPQFDPMPRVLGRLEAAGDAVAEPDRRFITGRHSELRRTYEAMSFDLDPGPIHGDAHLGNLMRREDGTVVLIDLEAPLCQGRVRQPDVSASL